MMQETSENIMQLNDFLWFVKLHFPSTGVSNLLMILELSFLLAVSYERYRYIIYLKLHI